MPHLRLRASCLALVAIAAWVTVLSGEATGRFNQPFDSGQPRELINRPVCWALESPDEADLCFVLGEP